MNFSEPPFGQLIWYKTVGGSFSLNVIKKIQSYNHHITPTSDANDWIYSLEAVDKMGTGVTNVQGQRLLKRSVSPTDYQLQRDVEGSFRLSFENVREWAESKSLAADAKNMVEALKEGAQGSAGKRKAEEDENSDMTSDASDDEDFAPQEVEVEEHLSQEEEHAAWMDEPLILDDDEKDDDDEGPYSELGRWMGPTPEFKVNRLYIFSMKNIYVFK
jgi:hypothetical protein